MKRLEDEELAFIIMAPWRQIRSRFAQEEAHLTNKMSSMHLKFFSYAVSQYYLSGLFVSNFAQNLVAFNFNVISPILSFMSSFILEFYDSTDLGL